MLWKTHIRLANEVLYKLGLPISSPEADGLREGSVVPDKWKDYPHHHGKDGKIRKYIMAARRYFLDEDLPNAYFHLGVALHYIQDSYTSFSSRFEKHNDWEQQIEQARFADDLERLVTRAFSHRENRKQEYTHILAFWSKEAKGKQDTLNLATMPGPGLSMWHERTWGRPDVDLNFAFRASFLVARSVLSSKNCSELQEQLTRILVEYEAMLRETETIFADKIVELIKKGNRTSEKMKSGTFQVIKNFFSAILRKIYILQAESRIQEYEQRKHLKKVTRKYHDAAQNTVTPYRDWYNFTTPEININIVENELLPMEIVPEHFGIDESLLKYLLDEEKISCYHIRNKELIRKSQLIEALRT